LPFYSQVSVMYIHNCKFELSEHFELTNPLRSSTVEEAIPDPDLALGIWATKIREGQDALPDHQAKCAGAS
jgi:hypothetical protein